MRKGFTMIELIFVIVILGVLASVAIPRLAATRDDAEVAKAATNLATAVSDITAYYTAKGKFQDDTGGKFDEMTSAVASNGKLNVKGDKSCATLSYPSATALTTTDKVELTITFDQSADPVCKQLMQMSSIKSMCGEGTAQAGTTALVKNPCTIQVGGSGGIQF